MKRIKRISDCFLPRATAFFLIIFIVMFGPSLYEEEKSEGKEKGRMEKWLERFKHVLKK